jgi:hypothetical protein
MDDILHTEDKQRLFSGAYHFHYRHDTTSSLALHIDYNLMNVVLTPPIDMSALEST